MGVRAVAGAVLTVAVPLSAAVAQARPQPGEGSIAARLGELPPAQRTAWGDYVAASRALAEDDRRVMAEELAGAGRERMVRAPEAARAFDGGGSRPAPWFATDSARRMADVILTYQTPAGGWSKRVAYERPRAPGESWYSGSDGWNYIGTLDNGSTTSQLWFLTRVHGAQPDTTYARAMVRGIDYLMTAQLPTGCWPQVFPLQGSYHDAATFNDDATVNALEVLEGVVAGEFPVAGEELRLRAASAWERGIECIVASQVVMQGRRTAWGQQHDPITLAPVDARSYEIRSLSGKESAAIMTYLMSLEAPDRRIADAINGAAAHFKRTAIHGYTYDVDTGLRRDPAGGPIWARMLEIGTNRPIFSNRDGVKLYDWNQLTDRRTGYAWYGTEPGSALQKYAKWLRAHPEFVPVEK